MRLPAPTSKNYFLWRVAPFDFFWAIITPFIALSLRDPSLLDVFGNPGALPHSLQYAGATIAITIPVFLLFRLSEGMSRFFSIRDSLAVINATLTTVAVSSLALFMINRLEGVPRSTPLIYGLVLVTGLLGGRAIARVPTTNTEPRLSQQKAPHLRRVILIGVDRYAAVAIKLTDLQKPRTTQFIAALDNRLRLKGRTVNGVKIVGVLADLTDIIKEYAVHGIDVDEVWVCDHCVSKTEFDQIDHQCRARGIAASAISQALNLHPAHKPFSDDEPIAAAPASLHLGYFRFKRVIDVVAASVLIVFLAPVTLLIAGLTFLNVGDPILFWQRRIGRGGREFMVLKFRTFQAPFTKNGTPVGENARLSPIGKAIRSSRLDEIPQLYNILRGDMSLIGPRPLLPIDQPDDPRSRLLVRPGVTGWAQVNGGALVTPKEKDAMDVWYIHHASLKLDCHILLRTLLVVVLGESKESNAIESALLWNAEQRQIDAV